MNDYNFGNFLYMLRSRSGMTQADVASKLGVTPAAVSKWENGSSKPRVEILFQLAQLLGVRTEELMCGQFIQTETLDPEAVRQINDRYNYLVKVDSCNTIGVKWRRFLAWIIDWIIISFLVLFALVVLTLLLMNSFTEDQIVTVITPIMLAYPFCFVMRDTIGGGRSLGKRITGLVVLNKRNGLPPSIGKCALRNLFLFLVQIDAIFLLASGSTIGDRAAQTVVVRKKVLEEEKNTHEIAELNTYSTPKKANALKVLLFIAGGITLLFVIVNVTMRSTQKTEQYKMAYHYLVQSQSYAELEADVFDIRYTNFYRSKSTKPNRENATDSFEFGFVIKDEAFLVICHKQDGVWSVCENCTDFK